MSIREVKVGVWCTMSTARIAGPVISETINTHRHIIFLQYFLNTTGPVPFSFRQAVEIIIALFRVYYWRENNQ